MFSRRSSVELQSDPLTIALKRLRDAGETFADLTQSNPTVLGFTYPEDSGSFSASEPYHPASLGSLAAREVVVDMLLERAVQVTPEQVLLTSSTSEAYGMLFKLLCDPGDEVLVPTPSYPLLDELARCEGIRLARYSLGYDGAWHIDFEAVAAAIHSRTRAIVVVSPNNPTGHYLRAHELRRLSRFGLPLIVDEVFFEYPLLPRRPGCAPALASPLPPPSGDEAQSSTSLDTPPLIFSLDGLSKLVGRPGAKLGWIVVGPPSDIQRDAVQRMSFILDAYLSVGAAVQANLGPILEGGRRTRREILSRAQDNLRYLQATLEGLSATVLAPEGGWSAIVQLPNVLSEEAWCLRLLEGYGVRVQPGWLYDIPLSPCLVVSLLPDETEFGRGVLGIAALVRELA